MIFGWDFAFFTFVYHGRPQEEGRGAQQALAPL